MHRWKVLSKTGGLLGVVWADTEQMAIEMVKERGHKACSATKI